MRQYVHQRVYLESQTRFALRVFVRGILENPEAQKKAQEEIDAVVRPGHLPDFADEADLPWVTACVKETLRWWPILPLGGSIGAFSVVLT